MPGPEWIKKNEIRYDKDYNALFIVFDLFKSAGESWTANARGIRVYYNGNLDSMEADNSLNYNSIKLYKKVNKQAAITFIFTGSTK